MSLQMYTSKVIYIAFATSLLQQFSLRVWDFSQQAIDAIHHVLV